jgi:TolB-like protein/tetratricopeptide (TPR) repeat protein/DNA-binding winged helix-turn-helix (wHTH) protein
MDASDLQGGFRLGEWMVEPGESKATGPGGRHDLTREHLALLLALAERAGKPVSRRELRERAWPGKSGTDASLRDAIRSLRELLGGSASDRRYIVPSEHSGFALVAPVTAVVPSRPLEAPDAGQVPEPGTAAGMGRLQALVVELHRRSVLKVLGAYLVGMWVVLQVAETTFEPLRLPDWWMTALTIIAIVGVPIVAALAWSYEITAGGIVLDQGLPRGVKMPRARRAVAPALVAGVALMAAVTGYAWWRTIAEYGPLDRQPGEAERRSIAVLPLTDMSAAGDSGYVGDGLSEELSSRLAQIPGLRVAARTSAFEFKDRNVDVRRIGESLGVRYVLEGSVRRDGDKLRVTVQLIDASNGYHVWTESYDRSWREVIAIQDDIARSVTDALRLVLAPRDPSEQGPLRTPDPRAYDSYFAGLAMLQQSGDTSRLREAERRFGEAVAIDPSFARAHAASCEVGMRLYRRTRDPEYLARAEQSCRRALDLDPALLETEKALAGLYEASGRLGEAEASYRRLITRNPGDADGQIGLGRTLESAGRFEEAEANYRAAVQAEPTYWGGYSNLGAFLMGRGRAAEAVEAFREATEITPSSASAYTNYGAALQLSGDLEGSAEAYRRSLAIEPSAGAYSNVGTAYYFLRNFPEAAANYERATALAEHDQVYWGNLGDALWQIPARRSEAIGHYRRAIALAERELKPRPGNAALALRGLHRGGCGVVRSGRRLRRRDRRRGAGGMSPVAAGRRTLRDPARRLARTPAEALSGRPVRSARRVAAAHQGAALNVPSAGPPAGAAACADTRP